MRQRNSSLVGSLVLAALVAVCVPAWARGPKPEEKPQTASLEDLLGQVKTALAIAEQDALHQNLPPLKSIELTIQAAVARDKGGTFKLFVLKLGSTTTLSQTRTLKLVLTPPEPSRTKSLVANDLASVILSAAQAVKTARESDLGYVPEEVVAEYSFGIKGDRSGGLALEVLPVSLELSSGTTRQAIQTITVTFKKKPAASPK